MEQTPGLKNKVGKIHDSIDAASESAKRLATAKNRLVLAIVLIALAAFGFEVFKYFDSRNRIQVPADYRQPVADPPIEPDRPDLFEEPRIDE